MPNSWRTPGFFGGFLYPIVRQTHKMFVEIYIYIFIYIYIYIYLFIYIIINTSVHIHIFTESNVILHVDKCIYFITIIVINYYHYYSYCQN